MERCGAIDKNDTSQTNFTVIMSYGGRSVMEWSGICLGACTELVLIEIDLTLHNDM